jgi:hypothetical protein
MNMLKNKYGAMESIDAPHSFRDGSLQKTNHKTIYKNMEKELFEELEMLAFDRSFKDDEDYLAGLQYEAHLVLLYQDFINNGRKKIASRLWMVDRWRKENLLDYTTLHYAGIQLKLPFKYR